MKIFNVTIVDPKPEDRRKTRFKIVYCVHAKTKVEARGILTRSVHMLNVHAGKFGEPNGRKIVKIVESKQTILSSTYFTISATADI
jgi:hypothetical protein